jgi:hypothetical protein
MSDLSSEFHFWARVISKNFNVRVCLECFKVELEAYIKKPSTFTNCCFCDKELGDAEVTGGYVESRNTINLKGFYEAEFCMDCEDHL